MGAGNAALQRIFSGQLAFTALVLAAGAADAVAAGYPEKPIRFIVPNPPGGGADLVARVLGAKLTEHTGQQVVVDNRAGAAGVIGTDLAARAEPNGYTLLLGYTANLCFAPSLFAKLPYDPVRDFAPVTLVGSTAYVLAVHPSVPAKSVKELIALARAKPGQLNFASIGNGQGNHLAGELFNTMSGAQLQHVPYKGGGAAVSAVLSGEAQLIFGSMLSTLAHVRAGKLRALGITAVRRSSAAPDVPTIAESGLPGYSVSTWMGVLVPAGTRKDIVEKLHAEIVKALETPDVKQRFSSQGLELAVTTPAEFAQLIKSETGKWAKVIKSANLRIN
jgi:tripartite-type tricarboxylate transporter receptor subunit TctC